MEEGLLDIHTPLASVRSSGLDEAVPAVLGDHQAPPKGRERAGRVGVLDGPAVG